MIDPTPERGPAGSGGVWERLYRLALRAYPKVFRDEFGPEMLAVFRHRTRARDRRGMAAMKLAWSLSVDLVRSAARERWDEVRHREELPDRRGLHREPLGMGETMIHVWNDLKLAVRGIVKSPGFAAVAILTLALGIGANTAMFTLVNSVVLKPLPYPDSERLVALWHSYPRVGLLRASLSAPNWRDYTRETEVFEGVAAFRPEDVTLTGDSRPARLSALRTTANFFDVLGVGAMLGRTFAEEEGEPGRNSVVVLTHGTWQERFGGAEDVVGRTLVLDDVAHEIVGVLEAGFTFRNPAEAVVPWGFTPEELGDDRRGQESLGGVARLREGVGIDQARTHMAGVARRIDEAFGRGAFEIGMAPLRDDVVGGDVRPALFLLLGAVGFVLLIGCANVANLLFARGEARQREVAVRTALGATRKRLFQQFLTESLVLGVAGGLAGLAVAVGGLRFLTSLPDLSLPRSAEISLDGTVLLFTGGVVLVTGLLFGVAPALRTLGHSLAQQGSRRTVGGDGRGRRLLVLSEVTLALVLVTGAGLMIKSFAALTAVDLGFATRDVMSMQVTTPASKYGDDASRLAFYDRSFDAIRSIPGVAAVAGIMPTPMSGQDWSGSFRIEGVDYSDAPSVPNTKMRYVTGGYFELMGIPVLTGRTFDARDASGSVRVAVVDERFVELYIPAGADPLTQRLDGNEPVQIIGVVGDVQDMQAGADVNGHIYWPYSQNPVPMITVLARTGVEATSVAPAMVREIQGIDPDQAPFDLRTLEERVSSSVSGSRFSTGLLGTFAAIALALAMIGIYGVLAYSVSRRIGEIGVRTAMGASRTDVIRLVVWQGMQPALGGVILGLVLGLLVTRAMTGLLYGVSPTDPLVFAGVAGLVVATALLACYVPARRASMVNPVDALRFE